MLKTVYVIPKTEYGNGVISASKFSMFCDRMEKEGIHVCAHTFAGGMEELPVLLDNCLFISDSAELLERLKKEKCYTIAWYHEAVTESLFATEYAICDLTDVDAEFFRKAYERYEGLPWHIADTERLLIREMCEADLEGLYQIYADPRVTRYTEELYQNPKQELQYIRDYIKNVYHYYGFGIWMLLNKSTGSYVGRAGLSYRPGYEEAELGFVINSEFWRQGYAYEACQKILQLGREVYEINRVQALVIKENAASVSLLKKLHFTFQETVILNGQEYERYLRIK